MANITVITGAWLLGISILADVLGFGNGNGFGVKQATGAIAGIVIVILGLLLIKKFD